MAFLLALVSSFLLAARSYDPVDYRTPVFALDIVCILMTIWFLCDEIAELKRWIFHKLSLYYYSGTSIYIEVLFHLFYCYWSKENRSLYRGLRSTYRGSLYRGSTVLFQKFKKVAQRSQAILIRTTKEYTLTLFFVAYILNFKYSQIPLIRILRGHRKCPYERGVRIKCVELREIVRALFPQGQSKLSVKMRYLSVKRGL